MGIDEMFTSIDEKLDHIRAVAGDDLSAIIVQLAPHLSLISNEEKNQRLRRKMTCCTCAEVYEFDGVVACPSCRAKTAPVEAPMPARPEADEWEDCSPRSYVCEEPVDGHWCGEHAVKESKSGRRADSVNFLCQAHYDARYGDSTPTDSDGLVKCDNCGHDFNCTREGIVKCEDCKSGAHIKCDGCGNQFDVVSSGYSRCGNCESKVHDDCLPEDHCCDDNVSHDECGPRCNCGDLFNQCSACHES